MKLFVNVIKSVTYLTNGRTSETVGTCDGVPCDSKLQSEHAVFFTKNDVVPVNDTNIVVRITKTPRALNAKIKTTLTK